MTTTERGFDYAFFTNGANFAGEVLRSLRALGHDPRLLVLPEYPPAAMRQTSAVGIYEASPEREILSLATGVEVGYAPASEQSDCAAWIRQRKIDFALVACWPYLISEILIASPLRAMFNLHPSLLPKYPGPNPLQQQMADGDNRFGVTLHLLNQKFDQGEIVAQAELSGDCATLNRQQLEDHCARRGAELFIDTMAEWAESRGLQSVQVFDTD